jgi:hypothetical protein
MTNFMNRISSMHATTLLNTIANFDDDDIDADIRNALMTATDECTTPLADTIALMIDALDRDDLTTMRLAYSICPMHACDYAICFDDDEPECAAIRAMHPSHDT